MEEQTEKLKDRGQWQEIPEVDIQQGSTEGIS